jgi:hypothetical protein
MLPFVFTFAENISTMTWPSDNITMVNLTVPEEGEWSTETFDFLQDAYAHQLPTSMIAEPSMISADHLLKSQSMHYPYTLLDPQSTRPAAWTLIGLHDLNPSIAHHSPTGDYSADWPVANCRGAGDSTPSTTSAPSILFIQEVPQPKAKKDKCIKRKRRDRGKDE